MSLLAAADLRKAFGGLTAVDGVGFSIDRGELVGMIGPNGAGKTTLFHCLSGVLEPDGGTVTLDGEDVTGAPPHKLARGGLVRTFQRTRELTTLTVRENMLLPTPAHPGERAWNAVVRTPAVAEREGEAMERAEELLSFFELEALAEDYASSLSGGQRKLLEMSRALMLDPDVLLLDEPLAGVNPALGETIVEYVERLNDDGMTFLVIEHEIETLAELVDRLIVLNEGRILADGDPGDVLSDPRVVDAYLGG